MPRLPTIRVIGSHDMSTRVLGSFLVCWGPGTVVVIEFCLSVRAHLPGALRSRGQFLARMPPLRLLVDGLAGDVAQIANHRPIEARRGRGYLAARWLIHEGHELVGEARHRASDADAADVRAASDTVDPASLRHVALDDWTPAAKLHNAFRRPILGREIALLVVAGLSHPSCTVLPNSHCGRSASSSGIIGA